MSNVIQFLEAQGRRPACMNVSEEAYAEVIASLDVDAAQREALKDRDATELNRLLDGRTKMYCVIMQPNEEDEQSSTPDEQDGDSVPDDEESQ